MGSVIGPIFVGIISVIIGILNTKGNIASLHWYHRQRVTEENKIPFGKLVGSGTIIIGVSIIMFGLLSLATKLLRIELFEIIGSVLVIIGLVAGLGLSFYAMFKYNKGIF